jgi:hypothetical protein
MYGGQVNTISVHTTAVVSGVATIEGYSAASFGENETNSLAQTLADFLNIDAPNIKLTLETTRRRSLLTHTPEHVGIDYDISVADAHAGEAVKASIRSVRPDTLVIKLRERGMNVSNISMTVFEPIKSSPGLQGLESEMLRSRWNLTIPPGTCAMVPSAEEAITVSGLADGADVKAELFSGVRSSIVVNDARMSSPTQVKNGDMLRIYVCTPLTPSFTETFDLSYGGQLETITVRTIQSPPSPPAYEEIFEEAEAAANVSAVAKEVLIAAVGVDCSSRAAAAQNETIASVTALSDATAHDATEQANLTALQVTTAATAATAASNAAAQGAIDVANTAITGATTASVAAEAAGDQLINRSERRLLRVTPRHMAWQILLATSCAAA